MTLDEVVSAKPINCSVCGTTIPFGNAMFRMLLDYATFADVCDRCKDDVSRSIQKKAQEIIELSRKAQAERMGIATITESPATPEQSAP